MKPLTILYLVKLPSLKSILLPCRANNNSNSDTREELTALKALDKLLRKYDRRSTPTNDLGKIAK